MSSADHLKKTAVPYFDEPGVRFDDPLIRFDDPRTYQEILNQQTLPSGQKVWVRLRAVNARGKSPWSDPACKRVPSSRQRCGFSRVWE